MNWSQEAGGVARRALVVYQNTPEPRESRLGRILEFFGVPWQLCSIVDLPRLVSSIPAHESFAILGSMDSLAAAASDSPSFAALRAATAVFAYASEDVKKAAAALSALTDGRWSVASLGNTEGSAAVSRSAATLTGAMSGVHATVRVQPGDMAIVAGVPAPRPTHEGSSECVPILSLDEHLTFGRLLEVAGRLLYVSGSARIIDIDQAVLSHYYDVKSHFLSVVPLVMFIRWAFKNVCWHTPEVGACLIIDDPLLRRRYGYCDFVQLRGLMDRYDFTANIAFIPWNWWRTSPAVRELFQVTKPSFSLSIHGCDHTAKEFGSSSVPFLQHVAALAQRRMAKHEARTRITHEPVMVFPQGVFSSLCGSVLKRAGFVAAINTEVVPVDAPAAAVRSVWDTAITEHGTFAVYTRRYSFHGLENFAFDILLGKPCFIVGHHDFFRDDGAELVALLESLRARDSNLQWRSPLEVIRRSYRVRETSDVTEVRMYANEAILENASATSRAYCVTKAELDPGMVASVEVDGIAVDWSVSSEMLTFACRVPAAACASVKIAYQPQATELHRHRSLKHAVGVAARRWACELRDELLPRLLRFRPIG